MKLEETSTPGNLLETLHMLPAMMPDAWSIFFNRRHPRPMQIQAMPPIVRGESVLLSAPTASGKTEAAVTPLYQRHLSFRRKRLSVIYIAPTKALVNDLYFRLQGYLETRSTGLISRYTGDHHDFNVPDHMFLLFTTPEALDSLQLMKPESLSGIRAIVVDEIHLLHGTARGQQLRHVINRLKAASGPAQSPKDVFQIVGMTATIDDIENVGKLWVGDTFTCIVNGEPRKIEMNYLEVSLNDRDQINRMFADTIARWLENTNPRKVLIFGNSRNSTHALAVALHDRLKITRWPVYWHIGLLAASERERIEIAMKHDAFGVCVATSTLEVGIDIGDIDAIILAEPPFSVNTFLQRIGRGNRFSNICRVGAICANEHDKTIFRALHHCAESGVLDDVHEYDRPAVRFQQLLSLAWRGIQTNSPLTKKNITRRAGDPTHQDVLDDMLKTEVLKEIEGALILSDKLIDDGDRRQIHSNIIGSGSIPIIDTASGEVAGFTDNGMTVSGHMFYDGKLKKVIESSNGKIHLEPLRGNDQKVLVKLPTGRGMKGISRHLIWAIAELSGRNPRQWLQTGNRLVTWGGSRFNQLLSIILKKSNVTKAAKYDDYCLDGLDLHLNINPVLVHTWAKQICDAKNISAKEAFRFCEQTKYLRLLSHNLQHIEALNAIPFNSFFMWLEECEREVYQDT